MSANVELSVMEDQPHAFVQFHADQEKIFTPVSCVKSFPPTWRESKWDKDYLYKVFWSPIEGDTPAKMLQRVPEIPLYETGTSLEKPGYYRAVVVAVDENLASLTELLETKRLSVGLMKFKRTSFDSKDSQKQVKEEKNALSKSKQPKVVRKPRGINKEAHKNNTEDVCNQLNKRFPFLNDKSEVDEDSPKPVKNMSSGDFAMKGSQLQTNSNKPSTSKGSTSNPKRRITDKSKTKNVDTDTSDEDSLEFHGKKIILDPDYTPKKGQQLESDLKVTKISLEKSFKTNEKLRGQVNETNCLNEQLQKEVAEWKAKLASAAKGHSTGKMVNNQSCLSLPPPHFSRDYSNEKTDESSGNDQAIDWDQQDDMCETVYSSGVDTENVNVKTAAEASGNQESKEPKVSEKADSGAGPQASEEGNSEGPSKKQPTSKPYDLMPGVTIPADVWEVISSIPAGKKKDLQYIKDLSTVVHGPETLASSTILGTKKEKLIERVEKEEGEIDADENARTKTSVYHEAIRGAQKRLQQLGYGAGKKCDKATIDILMTRPTD
ncbi:hypothetical protein ONE63_007283 [Megalurothrips usitatus]|uniref:Uncharacterized protein n=1 Tax=Megalurothrips usitatus TaxID=439358 RepID=A0AAV7XWF6_9NEOP|nr:hypothetical protein ONE63_007283 [Megalurothrips usitatus]